MNKLKTLLRNEVSGWKAWEVIWLSVALAIIIALGIFGHDTAMGIVSSTTGLAYSILSGKGKLSAYLCGLINATLYAIISYKAALYGETMLNAIYYVPMMFVTVCITASSKQRPFPMFTVLTVNRNFHTVSNKMFCNHSSLPSCPSALRAVR